MINTTMLLFSAVGIIVATTTHEFTRALTSTLLGDTLPKNKGRLTLNPIKHFEPIGFFLMFATNGFGWGKPVETTSLYYKNRKRDILLTAIMPSIANLLVAFISLKIANIFIRIENPIIYSLFSKIALINIGIVVYNIVPVSPMDGAKILSYIIPANNYFKYLQYEKIIQAIFLLFLFMGLTDIVFSPLIDFLFKILKILS